MSRMKIMSSCTRHLATLSSNSLNPARLFVNSDLSERYAKFRPKLPVQHVETVVNKLKRKPGLWVDVGCGPGTSTEQIVGYSDKIIGLDISETQLEVARKNITDPSVTFLQGSCDTLPVPDNSVDVVSAVQAAHYFDLPAFFKEIDRCLRSGGLVSLICYPDPHVSSSPALNSALSYINQHFLVNYFPDSRKQHFSDRYKSIEFPYPSQEHVLDLNLPMSYLNLIQLISSWSGFQNYCSEQGYSVEEGCAVLDGIFSRFVGEQEKEQLVLSYTCTMITATKP